MRLICKLFGHSWSYYHQYIGGNVSYHCAHCDRCHKEVELK